MSNNDLKILLNCAFRYALGRNTYVVGVVVNEILNHWDELDDSYKQRIVGEIWDYKKDFGNLGHHSSEANWLRIVNRYKYDTTKG